MEPDYLLCSKVSPHWTPVFLLVKYSLQGGSRGQRSPSRGLGAVSPKLKIDVKLPCKSLVISSKYGPFIRQMI